MSINPVKCICGAIISGKGQTCRSCSKKGEKNPHWKGNAPIHYTTLHNWVRRWKPKPKFCEYCKKVPPFDLANICNDKNEKTYTRDFRNWVYLCRRCHMQKDGRTKALHKKAHTPEAWKKISETRKRIGFPSWNKGRKNCFSAETIRKMSEAKKGKPSPRRGAILSEEIRRKISETKRRNKDAVWLMG